VLRRFDCILAPTKNEVLIAYEGLKGKSENIINAGLREVAGVPFLQTV
jgi:type I restriction enzyme M protein